MNHDLKKFHNWLISSTFKSDYFEKKIKSQLTNLLSWFLYPEYRKQNSLIQVLIGNRLIILFFLISLMWSSTFFTFGRLSSGEDRVLIKTDTIVKHTNTVLNLKNFVSNRKYVEYIAYTKYKIENYKNLQKLPDEVFLTILTEVNQHNIPPSIFFRLLDQESGFLYVKNKNSGASGYGQVLPSTRKSILKIIGSTNHERIDNIRIAAYHLKKQYELYDSLGYGERESWLKSLVDYNGGSHELAKENMLYFHQRL